MSLFKSRLSMSGAAVAAVLACAVTQPVRAQDKPVELKLAHWVPASHPLNKAMEDWGNAVNKASGGSITYKVYPAQQLGKAFDHYDMARDGIADVTYVNPGYQPGRFPIAAAGELPFLMKDAKTGSQAFDEWYRPYAAKEMKDVKYCLAFVHDPSAFHTRTKKVLVPEDIKGMKIRPPHATFANLVTALGGTNIQSSAPEVRDVLEKGVADGVAFPWGSLVLFGADKVTKYHMDAPLYVTTFVWVMNTDKYNSLSAGQKKAIDDNCNGQAAANVGGPWAEFENAGRGKVRALEGHEVYSLTPDQIDAWRKAAAPIFDKWSEGVTKAGADPKAAMDGLKASLAKYGAGL